MFADVTILAAMSDAMRGFFTAGIIFAVFLIVAVVVDRLLVRGLGRLAASTEGKLDDVIASAIKGVARWVFILIGLYYALPFIPIPERLEHEITIGSRIAVVALAIFIAARFASAVAVHYAHRFVPSSASIAKIVVNAVVFTLGVLVIFQTVGIQVTPIITALGIGGLAVALALQDTLGNFFAGLQILASKQIYPGDYVSLDSGQEGYVHDIGWRSMTMRTRNNNMVIVPNIKLAQAIVTNFSLEERDFGVRLSIAVAYGSDLDTVERVTIDVAREVVARVENTVKDYEPVVRFHAFGQSGIELNLVVRCTEYEAQYILHHEIIKSLHKRFAEERIEIPYPVRTVYLKDARV